MDKKMIQCGTPEAPIYNDVRCMGQIQGNSSQDLHREHIPKKIITKQSPPFWNKTLTELSLQIRTLRKVFTRTSTPAIITALNMARIEFKNEF